MTDPAPAPAASPPRVKLRVVDILCGTGLALGIIATYVFIALAPSMLKHHGVLLEALDGSDAAIVSGAAFAKIGRQSLALVILAPLCTILLYDVFFWWAGRLWGDKVLGLYTRGKPRLARWTARVERVVRRRGVLALAVGYYLPIPNVIIFVSCGVSGMSLATFLLGDLIGLLLWESLLVGLGWAIGHRAVHIVNVISHYSLIISVGLIVIVMTVAVLRQRRYVASQT
jgi:membrane-associated protein